MAAIPFDAFGDAFQVIQRVTDEREERGSEDRFRTDYDPDVVVNDPLAEDVAAHERQNGHDAEHDCNAVRCDLRQIRSREILPFLRFRHDSCPSQKRQDACPLIAVVCSILREKRCCATAGVRGMAALSPRVSFDFPHAPYRLRTQRVHRRESCVSLLDILAGERDVS